MTSSSAQWNGIPGAGALSGDTLRTQAMSQAPHLMKNVKLISGALLVPDKFKTRPTSSYGGCEW
jgi:hypothetical protein